MADLDDLCSNQWDLPFTPEELRNLAVPGNRGGDWSQTQPYQAHELSRRLGSEKVKHLVERARAGESVRALARELGIAHSALTRMLREEGVTISKRKITGDEMAMMAREYEAGATMAELERKFGLSHGVVYRALHRAEVRTRAGAPRSHLA